MKLDTTRILVTVLIGVPVILFCAGWLAWRGMGHVNPDIARLWALLATGALPVTGWLCYRLGHTEARGRLKGIDDGLERVARGARLVQDAAASAIDLRGQAAGVIKRATAPDPEIIVDLPPLEDSFSMRRALPAGEIVDLE